MPLHQNQDGTWQWGKSGKKYKKKEDAIKQMKAIFANGYVEKYASLNDPLFTDINYKGNSYMTYTDVYRMFKTAAPVAAPTTTAKPAVKTPRKPVKAPIKTPDPLNEDYDPRYEVKPGDTIGGSIYRMAGGKNHMDRKTFQKQTLRQNGLKRPQDLRAGSRIYVPGR